MVGGVDERGPALYVGFLVKKITFSHAIQVGTLTPLVLLFDMKQRPSGLDQKELKRIFKRITTR